MVLDFECSTGRALADVLACEIARLTVVDVVAEVVRCDGEVWMERHGKRVEHHALALEEKLVGSRARRDGIVGDAARFTLSCAPVEVVVSCEDALTLVTVLLLLLFVALSEGLEVAVEEAFADGTFTLS